MPIGRNRVLAFSLRLRYLITEAGPGRGGWSTTTVAYLYEVLDRQGRTMLAYHWHPIGHSAVTVPHLHVGCQTATVDFRKAHLPSGRITLGEMIRTMIVELDVEPLRSDWRELLDRTEREIDA